MLSGKELTVMQGTLLAIDPSSGSRNSQPGYSLYQAGVLIDAGIIKLKVGSELHSRLFHLADSIRNDFSTPDILVTEAISSVMNPKQGFMSKQMVPLQRAVGVVQSCFDCPVLEVAPATWRKYITNNYVKSDTNDAILLGYTALMEAAQLRGEATFKVVLPPAIIKQIGGLADVQIKGKRSKRKT